MRKSILTPLTPLLAAVLVLLASCGSSNQGRTGSASAYPQSEFSSAESGADAGSTEAEDWDESIWEATDDAARSTEYRGEDVDVTVTAGAGAVERKIITTVDLRMESTEYDQCVNSIYSAINSAAGYIEYSDIAGGIVQPREATPSQVSQVAGVALTPLRADYEMDSAYSESQYYRAGDQRYMYLRIRVPQANLESFLQKVESYGNVLSKQESAKDVTLEYVDIESRIKALQAEQEQLLGLLERSEIVEDMILLQERLSEIRYQIESYESQLRVMQNQVSYSTVNLTLNEVVIYTPPQEPVIPDPTVGQRIAAGFNKTLKDIQDYWVNNLVWLATNSIYIVTILLVLAVVFVILRRIVRKLPSPGKLVDALSDSLPQGKGEQPVQPDPGKKPDPEPEQPEDDTGKKKRNLTNEPGSVSKKPFSQRVATLLVYPFRGLNRLLKVATIVHGGMALSVYVLDFYFSQWLPTLLELLLMLTAVAFTLLYFFSYLTIPLTVLMLVLRWIYTPAQARDRRGLVHTILWIALQIFLAVLGWNAWSYLIF